jgi:hypothetical protein
MILRFAIVTLVLAAVPRVALADRHPAAQVRLEERPVRGHALQHDHELRQPDHRRTRDRRRHQHQFLAADFDGDGLGDVARIYRNTDGKARIRVSYLNASGLLGTRTQDFAKTATPGDSASFPAVRRWVASSFDGQAPRTSVLSIAQALRCQGWNDRGALGTNQLEATHHSPIGAGVTAGSVGSSNTCACGRGACCAGVPTRTRSSDFSPSSAGSACLAKTPCSMSELLAAGTRRAALSAQYVANISRMGFRA